MPPPFPTPASCAAACGRAARSLGLKLNFSKRYITLAPVATVIGLAFRMFDPEQLLGGKTDIGITCALIPRNTPGVSIGRRHFPLNIPFQNGPIQGKDVFVPLDCIIGGVAHGRRRLAHAGRAAVGRALHLAALQRHRRRQGGRAGRPAPTRASAASSILPVGRFEGVEAVIARMVGLTYTMDAARSVTAGAIDGGEKPSVPSAMLKYHVTEMGRQVANDAMDVHGGKGICLGPKQLSRPRLPGRCRWRSRSRAPTCSRATSSSSARARCAAIRSCCAR